MFNGLLASIGEMTREVLGDRLRPFLDTWFCKNPEPCGLGHDFEPWSLGLPLEGLLCCIGKKNVKCKIMGVMRNIPVG